MADRQKYNFLVALTRQLRQATAEEDECADEFRELLPNWEPAGEPEFQELADRVGKLEQWLAALETALESVEQTLCSDDGEDDVIDDDSDDDVDVGTVEPQVGGSIRRNGSPSVPVGNPERLEDERRRIVTTKKLVGGRRGKD